MKTFYLFEKPTDEIISDIEARASLAGFFGFPHGNFEQIEKYDEKVENWERWISQLDRGGAIAALHMTNQAFGHLLEAIALRGLNF